jgi:hypothetical protein
MNPPDSSRIRVHQDPELLRAAVSFTAAETGFAARLIEKDYFCSVVLQQLARAAKSLVFKGGTCLAKIHAGFYRLSEDLDFAIPVAIDAGRAERGARARGLKRALEGIGRRIPEIRIVAPLVGANNSTQYAMVVGYASVLSGQPETIKIEIGLREPLVAPAVPGRARTLLLDPISGGPLVSPFDVTCLSPREAMAEKLRAALSRREAAIRDFYDIEHAMRLQGFDPLDPALIEMVKLKLSEPFNEPVDVSETRRAALRRQVEPELAPVLRTRDLTAFDLDRVFALVKRVAGILERGGAR